MKTGIHWKRVVLAAFLSEVGVIVVISTAMVAYRFMIAPGRTAAEYQEFGRLAGFYLAVPAAALSTFLMAFQAVRKLESSLVANGALVGVFATMLGLGLMFGARPEDRPMYIASFAARIVAGYAAGVAAQRIKGEEGEAGHDHARQVR